MSYLDDDFGMPRAGQLSSLLGGNVFFKPNTEMAKWLIKYAGDRIIVDIGCGPKFPLLQQLASNGFTKSCGIDPHLDQTEMMKYRIQHDMDMGFHLLPGEGQRWADMYQDGEKMLLLFCRPCHSDFVEACLKLKGPNVEALYITIPDNIKKYNDLGIFDERKVLVEHKGTSADKEVVYSIR